MFLFHRVLRWLVQESMAVGADSHEALPVRLYTQSGATLEGILLTRQDPYTFAPGAVVMPQGGRTWHRQEHATYVPAAQVDFYTRLDAASLTRTTRSS